MGCTQPASYSNYALIATVCAFLAGGLTLMAHRRMKCATGQESSRRHIVSLTGNIGVINVKKMLDIWI
jgi:hypothetical protein